MQINRFKVNKNYEKPVSFPVEFDLEASLLDGSPSNVKMTVNRVSVADFDEQDGVT